LTDLLLYHVLATVTDEQFQGNSLVALNGETLAVHIRRGGFQNDRRNIFLAVNGNRVIGGSESVASNGAATVIDGVLIPSWVRNSITNRVVADSDLSTLLDVVMIAGLDGVLAGAGQLTLVAPINSAFAALGEELLTFLISTAGLATLTDILLYHVFPDILVSSELSNGLIIPTLLAGRDVVVTRTGAGILINRSEVVQADILTNNGVVHKIDEVLTIPE
jgi:uncharacterized surface protein with fasciclin (FAS1) repeats